MDKIVSSPVMGLSVPGIVFVIFLILKLTGAVQWSWVWVTSPLWIVAVIVAVLMLLISLQVFFSMRKK